DIDDPDISNRIVLATEDRALQIVRTLFGFFGDPAPHLTCEFELGSGHQSVIGRQVVTEISASRKYSSARFSRPYPRGLKRKVSSGNQIPTHTNTHPVVSSTILPDDPTS